jgi:hypothetical protein
MTTGIDLVIRASLVRYLSDDISLAEFEGWFVPVAWGIERTGNRDAIELAGEIELRLAEFSNGHWSEPELRSKLASLSGVYETELSDGVPDPSHAYWLRSSALDLREPSLQL